MSCAATALLSATALASTQTPAFRTASNLVSVAVLVTDPSGEPVSDLQSDRFAVFEDGAPRSIAAFAHERVPLSLAVALDASLSMDGDRFRLAGDAVRVLGGSARPGDQMALTAFNDTPFLVATWTSNVASVVSALAAVTPKGSTALYDGVEMALDAVGNATNPSGAVVIISDGHDSHRADMRPMREARTVDRIRRTDIAVFAIGLNVPAARAGDPANEFDAASLTRLSEPSGGFAQVVTSAHALPEAARLIRNQLEHRYVLGFVPEHVGDGRFHRLRVEVAACRCRVRARAGFLAVSR